MSGRSKETMPWSKFWWKDYDSDKALRRCSFEAQGLWMRLLCLMAEGEPYGYLHVEGRAPTPADIALMVGCKLTDRRAARMMEELRQAGVFSVTDEGIPYCRRMVRDAGRRAEAQANGARGGNPALRAPKNSGQTSGKHGANIGEECSQSGELVSSDINGLAEKGVNPPDNPPLKLQEARGQEAITPLPPQELPRPRTPPPIPSGPEGDLLGLINPAPPKPLVPEQPPPLPIHTGKPKRPRKPAATGKSPAKQAEPQRRPGGPPLPGTEYEKVVRGVDIYRYVIFLADEYERINGHGYCFEGCWPGFSAAVAEIIADGGEGPEDITPVVQDAARRNFVPDRLDYWWKAFRSRLAERKEREARGFRRRSAA